MALLKDVKQPTGLMVGYWIISGVQFYYVEKLCDATLSGYISSEARAEAEPEVLEPITSVLVRVPFNPTLNPPVTISDLREVLYPALETRLATMTDHILHGARNDGLLP